MKITLTSVYLKMHIAGNSIYWNAVRLLLEACIMSWIILVISTAFAGIAETIGRALYLNELVKIIRSHP